MLFGKYCEKCGVKVDKKTAPLRFGKYFCSNGHVKEYVKEMKEQRKRTGTEGQGRVLLNKDLSNFGELLKPLNLVIEWQKTFQR